MLITGYPRCHLFFQYLLLGIIIWVVDGWVLKVLLPFTLFVFRLFQVSSCLACWTFSPSVSIDMNLIRYLLLNMWLSQSKSLHSLIRGNSHGCYLISCLFWIRLKVFATYLMEYSIMDACGCSRLRFLFFSPLYFNSWPFCLSVISLHSRTIV